MVISTATSLMVVWLVLFLSGAKLDISRYPYHPPVSFRRAAAGPERLGDHYRCGHRDAECDGLRNPGRFVAGVAVLLRSRGPRCLPRLGGSVLRARGHRLTGRRLAGNAGTVPADPPQGAPGDSAFPTLGGAARIDQEDRRGFFRRFPQGLCHCGCRPARIGGRYPVRAFGPFGTRVSGTRPADSVERQAGHIPAGHEPHRR